MPSNLKHKTVFVGVNQKGNGTLTQGLIMVEALKLHVMFCRMQAGGSTMLQVSCGLHIELHL